MIYLLWIPFLIVLGIYCYFEKGERFVPATVLKVLLSAYVAVVALYAAWRLDVFAGYLMAVGLVCAVPADYFLQYIRSDLKRYRFGIFFFGAMHICLITSFIMQWHVGWPEFAIWALFILILSAIQKFENWDLGKAKLQLSIYTVLVVFMAAKAIAIFFAAPSPATLALGLGGFFFFVSDLFLGIWDYFSNKFKYLFLNRVIYFCGQLCLAFYLLILTTI